MLIVDCGNMIMTDQRGIEHDPHDVAFHFCYCGEQSLDETQQTEVELDGEVAGPGFPSWVLS